MEDTMRKLVREGLQRNIVIDGNRMVDKMIVRCWILKPIPDTGKINFKLIFLVFIDHKITCRKEEELHILDGTDTQDT